MLNKKGYSNIVYNLGLLNALNCYSFSSYLQLDFNESNFFTKFSIEQEPFPSAWKWTVLTPLI